MQEHPDSIPAQRTQPILPGATLPTTPTPAVAAPTTQPLNRRHVGLRAMLQLLGIGCILELCLLALYPLLAKTTLAHDPLLQALARVFPWAGHIYWTNTLPLLPQGLAHVSWLNPAAGDVRGMSNLLLLLLLLVSLCSFLAVVVGNRAVKARLSLFDGRLLFWTILSLTALFGITLLCAPTGLSALSQDTLLYGLYGHMVVSYHANPYTTSLASLPVSDPFRVALSTTSIGSILYGPLWMDLSILMTLLTRDGVVASLVGFRLLGLCAHLGNAALLWFIVNRAKPELRISTTLLYAWNPLVLLFSVTMMHQEVVLATLLLLAILFFQRSAPTLGWVLLLLAALINPLLALFLPLFLRFMARETRVLSAPGRLLWWIGMLCISALAVALAYAPYWPGWGIHGIGVALRQTFLQNTAINSLDAALLNLPIKLSAFVPWIISPHHWSAGVLIIAVLLVLLGLLVADTPDTLSLVQLFTGWILLLLVALMPTYWPWLVLPAFTIGLSTGSHRTILLATSLTLGGLISYYCWQWSTPWAGQGLITLGVPLLLWGWALFFSSTWHMTHSYEREQPIIHQRASAGLSRYSRPSRPRR